MAAHIDEKSGDSWELAESYVHLMHQCVQSAPKHIPGNVNGVRIQLMYCTNVDHAACCCLQTTM